MINIRDKHNCCGCSACVQACPKHCISFDEDEQGFRYPLVNKELCIDCGLCEKVCPCLNHGEPRKPINVCAAINPDEEIRMKSSSGGIFTLLAEKIIDEEGVVFGARFDENWKVKHDYTETKEGLEAFRGSKYVQSRIGETYKKTKVFLDEGRKVLFSGTSCQIAGLKKFLQKDYENLLAVDCVCHGVPSPLVWREYLGELCANGMDGFKAISFRDKRRGWKEFGLQLTDLTGRVNYEPLTVNPFLKAFLNNLSLRPSCFNCPARSGASDSDVTLADFWRVEEFFCEYNDDKGVSLVMANSNNGLSALQELNVTLIPVSYDIARTVNLCVEKSVERPKEYESFWNVYYKQGVSALYQFSRINREPLLTKIYKVYKKFVDK